MSAPASNTHQAWLTSHTQTFGKVDDLKCNLTHTLFTEVDPDNVETLDIDLQVCHSVISIVTCQTDRKSSAGWRSVRSSRLGRQVSHRDQRLVAFVVV